MIDKELQKKLRKKYNPEGSPLRNHQLQMVEILKYVDEVCKQNDIDYWLSSGTCLGAVRHGGFIPWDDDLDIEMTRENFLRFQSVFKETDKYVLQTRYNDKFFPSGFAKVRIKGTEVYDSLYRYSGIFVDVFCLEVINKYSAKIFNYGYRILAHHLYESLKRNRENSLVFYILSCIFTVYKKTFYFLTEIDRTLNLKNSDIKEYRHTYGTGWVNNTRDLSQIMPLNHISFEGFIFPIPHDPDSYLRQMYGDWENLPAENQMVHNHIHYI